MIPVNDHLVYEESLSCLSQHKATIGRSFKGRFFQIFLALKYYQNEIPSMHSGRFINAEVLQILLDDLYAKASKPLNAAVLMMFESSYLARTGVIGQGNTTSQNTWRNNLNIQKGIGCYAPPNILAGTTFLNQARDQCQFLDSPTTGVFSGSHCMLCDSGAYRSERHRKWLRIDPGRQGYAAIDSSAAENFLPYVAPNGERIPVLPLICALYHDVGNGLQLAQRTSVDLPDFLCDFNFSIEEFNTYFDDSPAHPLNARVLATGGNFGFTHGLGLRRGLVPVLGGTQQVIPIHLPALPPPGTIVAPPQQNNGWDAQNCVHDALRAEGWTVYDVSRMQLGCDLLAKKGLRTIFVEVKSSVATCAPVLTSREWAQAQAHTDNYVLAILENFDPTNTNTVFWVKNPAVTCPANTISTISYSIAHATWFAAAIAIEAV